jgi:hypothetical protein
VAELHRAMAPKRTTSTSKRHPDHAASSTPPKGCLLKPILYTLLEIILP